MGTKNNSSAQLRLLRPNLCSAVVSRLSLSAAEVQTHPVSIDSAGSIHSIRNEVLSSEPFSVPNSSELEGLPVSSQQSPSVPFATGSTTIVAAILVVAAAFALLKFLFRPKPGISGLPKCDERICSHEAAASTHAKLGDVFTARGFDGKQAVFVRGAEAVSVLSKQGFGSGKWGSGTGAPAATTPMAVPSNLMQPMALGSFIHAEGAGWKATRTALRKLFAPSANTAPEAAECADLATLPTGGATDAQALTHAALRDTMLRLNVGGNATSARGKPVEDAFVALEHVCNEWRGDLSLQHASEMTPPVAAACEDAMRACRVAAKDAIAAAAAGDAAAAGCLAAMLHASLRKEGSSDDSALEEVARTVFNLVVAGAESNAISTAKTLAAVATQPALMARLRAEVDAALPPGTPPNAVTCALLRKTSTPLLDACVREGLRLYAPATAVQRVAGGDLHLGGGFVPAGTTLCVCINALHMDERVWQQPAAFDPERFMGAPTKRPAHAWLPFSTGPRRCPGEVVAMLQARAMIARTVQRFAVTAAAPVPVAHVAGFTEWSPAGVPLHLAPREAAAP